ncbi:subtilisin-like protease [Mycena floridula]|nr:subtilisin-like protease [Mycena floridula]
MRVALSWPFVALCFSSALATVPISSIKRVTNLPDVPNAFIIEVDTASHIPTKRTLSPHENLYAALKERDVGFDVKKEFDSSGLFVGAFVTLQDAKKLATTPGIKAIRPVKRIPRPARPVSTHVVTGKDDPQVPPDTESTHVITGVDKLHAQGITGKGIKIGIIDTGIDYTHPALGAGFGPGHKVIGGFDFVGDNYDGTNTPVPDPDPLDQCAGHGTHVAGIIGADPLANPFNISGVAYEASITAYRIFGCTGCTATVIVEALLRGAADKQVCGPDGWVTWPSSWYTSSPGNGISVISVASLDNTVTPIETAVVEGVAHDPIPYFNLFPFPVNDSRPIFATSNDTTVVDDACNPLPDSTPDLSPFVVIVRRGTCSFAQKIGNIQAKGATVALIYDNGSGFSAIDIGNTTVIASLIQAADGVFLVQQFVAQAPITITFPQTGGLTQFPNPLGGLISSFSSYGPTNDMFFKPAVAAPGGNILSTLPVPLGSYAIESGTSMATPFVAGSAALLLTVKGKHIATSARTIFETTANTVSTSHTDGDPLQTATQQGAGLINVFKAIHTTTLVSPGELLLNDTAHFKGVHQIVVQNIGTKKQTYKLTHVPAGTAVTISPSFEGQPDIFPSLGPVPLSTDGAQVSFSSSSFTIAAGGSKTVTLKITPPADDNTSFPAYSGFVHITSDTDDVHVTYLGVAATLKDKQVLDDTDFFFGFPVPLILDASGNIQEDPTNYSFVGDDFPAIIWRQVFKTSFGTPVVRLDLVPFDFADTTIAGNTLEDRADENGFNSLALTTATFANGTVIPDGQYRLFLRSLRVTGDSSEESDYDSWLSPIIGVTA